jgi:aspartyl protease family protein
MFPVFNRKISGLLAILAMFLLLDMQLVCADDKPKHRQVILEGVLGKKAVFSIDGNRTLLSSGERKDGVVVLDIQTNSASVEIDGKRRKLRIGDSGVVAVPYKQQQNAVVTVAPDNHGMYTSVGSINGLPVSFLVDTGATSIAMNVSQARRLGIEFRLDGTKIMVSTASGMSKAYRVVLDTVSLGSITLHRIPAVVIEGAFPVQTLLGMSFLGQLDIHREGGIMRIKKKY